MKVSSETELLAKIEPVVDTSVLSFYWTSSEVGGSCSQLIAGHDATVNWRTRLGIDLNGAKLVALLVSRFTNGLAAEILKKTSASHRMGRSLHTHYATPCRSFRFALSPQHGILRLLPFWLLPHIFG